MSRRRHPPRWVAPCAVGLAVVGLLVSGYLTYEWATGGTTLACPQGETFDCGKVTSSPWSKVFGVPVAPLGVAYFAAMIALCLPGRLRNGSAGLHRVRWVAAGLGVAMVFYLIWAELFRIRAICVWCTVVHVATIALFAVLLFGHALAVPATHPEATSRDRVR